MARIAGVDLPKNKRIEIALTYIYGIGRTSAQKILQEAEVDVNKKTDQLDDEEVNRIRRIIDAKYKVEGEATMVRVSIRQKRSFNLKLWIIATMPTGVRIQMRW